MTRARGIIAAGHPATAAAAEAVLREGGNAFDAIVAAHFAACVAEPVLCSLAGGGFMLAYRPQETPRVYDFFVQTPQRARTLEQLDFYPIMADFGSAQQEFHIGLGAVATPGTLKGLFTIQRELCTMPMRRLIEPAQQLAREGLTISNFQAYIFSIVEPIYMATPTARELFGNPDSPGHILAAGQHQRQVAQADFMEALAYEGERLFYEGEVARSIAQLCQEGGGHLSRADLEGYALIQRQPLAMPYGDAQVFINPPPSSGGLLIAFALDLLGQMAMQAHSFGSRDHLLRLAAVMRLTHEARLAAHLDDDHPGNAEPMLNPEFLAQYRQRIQGLARAYRGTTHMSVIDRDGNIASMTVSNGEGCGHLIPGTGVTLNNMLGEEDLNPGGFHRWPRGERMTSMMAPALLLFKDGRELALGSGGSNRIRSALLQVISNLVDHRMTVEAAVTAPRLHLEGENLSIEGGFSEAARIELLKHYPQHTVWDEQNLFFGGAHTVLRDGGQFQGMGDPRRGGVSVQVL